LFTRAFAEILKSVGVKTIKLPPRSANLNPHAERFVRSIKSEALDKIIFFGERQLRHAVEQFLEHYHAERNHQGIDNTLILAAESGGLTKGEVCCRQRLGGLLRYYHRAA
jgi:transposase InsO family protein